MFMRMVYDERLAQAAYLIGCQRTGEAIVIDPQRDVDRYIKLAEQHGLGIVAAAETHIHADFVSGVRELAHRVGATAFLSGEGGPDWTYDWANEPGTTCRVLRDGDTFSIGAIEFRAIHTPGHTPEHLCFSVTDTASGADTPLGVLTGDFIFVGDLGRPDLLETAAGHAGSMERSARDLYRTVGRTASIEDFAQVWPGHGAGSACGKALGAVPASTMGYERRFNPAIRAATDERTFVDFILTGQPEPPLYFASMKRVNREGPAVLGGLPDPGKLNADALLALDPASAVIVDTRPWERFRSGHIPGSLSFPFGPSFCTDAGSFLDAGGRITLIVRREEREEAIRCLIRIGLDRVVSWFDADEFDELRSADASLASIEEISPQEARSRMLNDGWRVLDVRRMTEYETGHADGAINASHTRLASRLDEVNRDDDWLIVCRSGARSARSAAFLARLGYTATNVRGGMLAWGSPEG